jgi:hypothetical protein
MDYSILERRINEYDPAMMRLLYPKVYDSPGDFGSTKQVAIDLCTTFMCSRPSSEVFAGEEAYKDVALMNGVMTAEALIRYQVPTFFIAKDFFAAAMNSNPPTDFPVRELRFPFPSMVFMLPKGVLQSPTDGPIEYIAFSVWIDCPTEFPSVFADGRRFRVETSRLSWFTRAKGNTMMGTFGADVGDLDKGTLGDFFATVDTDSDAKNPSVFSLPIDEDDAEFMRSVPRVIFKLLLAITARPELVEHGFERKRAKPQNGQPRPGYWTPNIIGRKYRVATEGPRHTGNGSSPRMHWRRGHYRRQPFGERLQQSRVIWIDPMLISGIRNTIPHG